MALLEYTHQKAIGFAIGVVILFVLFPSLFGVMFATGNEVSYEAGSNYSTCGDFYFDEGEDRSRCTTQFLLVLGNTGTINQELITVTLDYVPEIQRMNWTTLDIVASSERAPRTVITEQRQGAGSVLTIEDLPPNRLVEFSFSARGPEAKAQIENTNVNVSTTGRILNSNPRLTVVSRGIRNVFSFFGA